MNTDPTYMPMIGGVTCQNPERREHMFEMLKMKKHHFYKMKERMNIVT